MSGGPLDSCAEELWQELQQQHGGEPKNHPWGPNQEWSHLCYLRAVYKGRCFGGCFWQFSVGITDPKADDDSYSYS